MSRDDQKKIKFLLYFATAATAVALLYLALNKLLPAILPPLLGYTVAALFYTPSHYLSQKTNTKQCAWHLLFLAVFYIGIVAFFFILGDKLLLQIFDPSQELKNQFGQLLDHIFSQVQIFLQRFIVQIMPSGTTGQQIAQRLNALYEEGISAFLSCTASVIAFFTKWIPSSGLALGVILLSSVFFCLNFPTPRQIFKPLYSFSAISPYISKVALVFSTAKKLLMCYVKLAGVTFVLLCIGLAILQVPYAPVLAIIIAIVDFLPVLGTGTVLLPWAVVLLAFNQSQLAIGLLILYAVIWVTHSILEPKWVGNKVGLPPWAALALLYAGGKLFGVAGMVVLPILASFCLQLYRQNPRGSG